MENRTTKEILDIFGEYDKVIDTIGDDIKEGETSGEFEWCFYLEEYDKVTKEMAEIFNGDDFASVTIKWKIDIE